MVYYFSMSSRVVTCATSLSRYTAVSKWIHLKNLVSKTHHYCNQSHIKQNTQLCRLRLQTDVMTTAEHHSGRRHVPGNEPKLLHNISNIHYRCCFHKHSNNSHSKHSNQNIRIPMFQLNTLERGWVTALEKDENRNHQHTAPFFYSEPPHSLKSRKSSSAKSVFWQVSPWGALSEPGSLEVGEGLRKWKNWGKNIRWRERDMYPYGLQNESRWSKKRKDVLFIYFEICS